MFDKSILLLYNTVKGSKITRLIRTTTTNNIFC